MKTLISTLADSAHKAKATLVRKMFGPTPLWTIEAPRVEYRDQFLEAWEGSWAKDMR